MEQFRQGRSPAWYWRQVFIAIIVGAVQEVRDHRLIAVRALVVGWTIVVIDVKLLTTVIFPTVWTFLNPDTPLVYTFFSRFLPLSWWHYYGNIIMPLYVLLPIVMIWVAGAGTGWIIARLHRPHDRTMVLLFAASVFTAVVSWFLVLVASTPERTYYYYYGLPGKIVLLVTNMMAVMCILLGGGLLNLRSKPPNLEHSGVK